MKQIAIVRTLGNDQHRHVVEEILGLLERHPVSIGAARNILDAASAALNFAPACIGELPTKEALWVKSPSARYTPAKDVTDILLRDVPDAC